MRKNLKSLAVVLAVTVLLAGLTNGTMVAKSKCKDKKSCNGYVLCNTLTSEILTGVSLSKKKLQNGLRVKMRTGNKKQIAYLSKMFERCQAKVNAKKNCSASTNELLWKEGVSVMVKAGKRSLSVELTSEDPALVKAIKKMFIPRPRQAQVVAHRRSSFSGNGHTVEAGGGGCSGN